MVEIKEKYKCCGCEACVQVCPKQCISFQVDNEGFLYPNVDCSTCVNCGLCEKACPVINQNEKRLPYELYAAINTNDGERIDSSSGGIFVMLAKKIIKEGGIVFGARFDENWNVVHSCTESIEGIQPFMGSKYVQSKIGDNYNKAKDFLKSGRKVLFSGTPCQIAGLKLYLRKDYDNLLTVDFICHGVPSPAVWWQYLKKIDENACKGENSVSLHPNLNITKGNTAPHGQVISGISFRDKRLGWKKYSFALTLAKATADGKSNTVSLSHIHRENPYMKLFLNNIILRPSCYHCPAKNGKSHSDITLADFWGIRLVNPEMDDDKGTSLVLVNTKKGKSFLPFEMMKYEKVENKVLSFNPSYYESVLEHPKRNFFFKKINKITTGENLDELIENCLKPSILQRQKERIKEIIHLAKRILIKLKHLMGL